MRRSDFHYELPAGLIAQHPAAQRSASRLLDVGPGDALADRGIAELPELLRAGDLLVFNDTRVIPARLHGHKATGGRVQVLVERVLGERELLAQLGVSKAPRPGMTLAIAGETLSVLRRDDDLFHLRYEGAGTVLDFLERAGRVPLPPYITHEPDAADAERYQTLFAREPGAVAAPTAGLHFDQELLAHLRERGIDTATLTLHVGAGTFQPIRVEELSEHRMHAEHYAVPQTLVEKVTATRVAGGRIVAVGTTVARALESAWDEAAGGLRAGEGETRLFITPGYRFRALDLLLTNFHLPESTLLMLVCAFAGQARVLAAYRHAVAQRYRFFSYGDAMLLRRDAPL
ncbi:MAG TPA: tRNA preQ1(34) S-adenosylmethionine ribosyltransferase-isomerase QueA [Solimonas sp.]|nr:tRNA preQ1(34) S-adenosylmethionine ribosyltransferase-isomerase QueA [Solimonas sp.]